MQYWTGTVMLVGVVVALQEDSAPSLTESKTTSPLDQLLATAAGGSDSLPLTNRQRFKRKPLRFRSKGESRFKPKSVKSLNSQRLKQKSEQSSVTTESRFADFPKRPDPFKQIIDISESPKESDINPVDKIEVVTTESNVELQDFLTTTQVVIEKRKDLSSIYKQSQEGNIKSRFAGLLGRPRPRPAKHFPTKSPKEIQNPKYDNSKKTFSPVLSKGDSKPNSLGNFPQKSSETLISLSKNANSIDSEQTDKNEILEEQNVKFKDLIERTGAQPVGVTRDLAQDPKEQEVLKNQDSLQRKDPQKKRRNSPRRGFARSFDVEANEAFDDLIVKKTKVPIKKRKSNGFKKKAYSKSKVGTLKSFRVKNEDGSITWGYHNDDGSFKEETIGVDCITHGRYGYTDSFGEAREYSYSSGVRCDPSTRKVKESDPGRRSSNGHGYFDYINNKFVMPDGRRVRVIVNKGHRARNRRY